MNDDRGGWVVGIIVICFGVLMLALCSGLVAVVWGFAFWLFNS
jgi:hypothetical protein